MHYVRAEVIRVELIEHLVVIRVVIKVELIDQSACLLALASPPLLLHSDGLYNELLLQPLMAQRGAVTPGAQLTGSVSKEILAGSNRAAAATRGAGFHHLDTQSQVSPPVWR